VQKVANVVHVNVQLIRTATDQHIWAESYNRTRDDVFAVEADIASAVAEQLNAKLSGAEQKAIVSEPTHSSAAYEAYLRGSPLQAKAWIRKTRRRPLRNLRKPSSSTRNTRLPGRNWLLFAVFFTSTVSIQPPV